METLTNKHIVNNGYLSRYNTVPIYYDTLSDRKVYGIGQSLNKDVPYVSHKVTEKDTLDNLALKYYNNPTYWWIIAYFNEIADAFEPLLPKYKVVQIPNIANINFIAEKR